MNNSTRAAAVMAVSALGFFCSSSPTDSPRAIPSGGGGSTTPSQVGSGTGPVGGQAAGSGSATGQSGTTAWGGAAEQGAGTSGSGGISTSGGSALGGSTGVGGNPRQSEAGGTGGQTAGGRSNAGGSSGRGGLAAGAGGVTGGLGGTGVSNSGGGAGTGGSANPGDGGGTSTGTPSAGSPSPGCGKAPTLTSGSRKIDSGGQSRSFVLRIPANYDKSHPYRLVFAFHWNGGTMNDIDGGGTSGAVWSYYGLQAQADNTTIFVAPQGNNNGWANPGGADLKFVDDMIAQIQGDLCVDTSRIFAMGFSYGGGMSYEIACSRAKVFRAVAVYSGAQLSGCDGGKDPIAYLGIHGVSDGTCNISGGRSLRDTFVKNNGCTAQSPPEPKAGSGTHTCTTYTGCSAGHPVEWCAFDGGHTPGMVDGGGDDGAKTWTKAEAWKFFSQF